jgi:hypothetical protein
MPSKDPSRTKLRNAKIAAGSAALPKISKEVLGQIVADGPIDLPPTSRTNVKEVKSVPQRPCLAAIWGFVPSRATICAAG